MDMEAAGRRRAQMGDSMDPLLRYLRRPNRSRLAEVVRAYHQLVWNTAIRVAGDPEDAEDICQDVFLKLLLDPPRPDQVSSARGYLAWSVIGRAGRLRRSEERRRAREREAVKRAANDGVPSPDVGSLHSALVQLPEDLRIPIELHYLGGLHTGQIAETLGIAERTVRDRIQRGREILARILAPTVVGSALLPAGLEGMPIVPPPDTLLPHLLRLVKLGSALAAPASAAAVGGALGKNLLIAAGIIFTIGIGLWSVVPQIPRGPADDEAASAERIVDPSVPDSPVAATQTAPAANPSPDPGPSRDGGIKKAPTPLRGIVVEAERLQPIRRAMVGLVEIDPSVTVREWHSTAEPAPLRPSTETDGQGRFALEVPETFAGLIGARAAGYFSGYVPWGEIGGDATFVLHRLSRLRVRAIEGDTGAPVAGAVIRVAAPMEPWRGGETASWSETSDAWGIAEFDGLPESWDLRVRVIHPAHAEGRTSARLPAEDLTVMLTAGATARGIVARASDGRPVAHACVEQRGFFVRRAETGADGQYVLRGLPIDGSPFVLHATAGGLATETTSVAGLGAGAETEVNFALRGTCRVSGSIIDEAGLPVPRALVVLHTIDKKYVFLLDTRSETMSSDNGTFEFEAVPMRAAHSIVCVAPPVGRGVATFTTSTEPECMLDPILLRKGLTLEGRATSGAEEKPLGGARLRAVLTRPTDQGLSELAAGARNWAATVDRAGRFAIGSLPEGRYSLVLTAPDGRTWMKEIEMREDASLEIVIPEGRTLGGTVFARGGGPIGDAVCCLQPARRDSPPRFALSNTRGAMAFANVPDGTFTLIVKADGHAPAAVPLTVTGDAPGAIEVILEDDNSVSGRVLDESGTPVPDAEVILAPKGRPLPCGSGRTNASGDFVATGLSRGEVYAVAKVLAGNALRRFPLVRPVTIESVPAEGIEVRVKQDDAAHQEGGR